MDKSGNASLLCLVTYVLSFLDNHLIGQMYIPSLPPSLPEIQGINIETKLSVFRYTK